MSEALQRSEVSLTKSQKAVLSFLSSSASSAVAPSVSSRKLASVLGLSRPTVQTALALLNDLGIVQTLSGSVCRASAHKVLKPTFEVPLDPGQIPLFTSVENACPVPGQITPVPGQISSQDLGKFLPRTWANLPASHIRNARALASEEARKKKLASYATIRATITETGLETLGCDPTTYEPIPLSEQTVRNIAHQISRLQDERAALNFLAKRCQECVWNAQRAKSWGWVYTVVKDFVSSQLREASALATGPATIERKPPQREQDNDALQRFIAEFPNHPSAVALTASKGMR